MELNGNTFLLANKKYPHANIAQWGTDGRDMGTYELKVYPDQLWQLKKDTNHPGFYYINNAKWDGYRIAKWGESGSDVGAYNQKYYDDQMWKFEHVEGDYTYSNVAISHKFSSKAKHQFKKSIYY